MQSVEWLPAIAILLAGIIAGIVFIRYAARLRREVESTGLPAVEDRDLLAKKESMLRQLRELDDTAAKRDAGQLARERYELELGAATVMREIDRRRAASPKPAATAAEGRAGAGSKALRGFLWGAGAMGILAALGFWAMQTTTKRNDASASTTASATGQPSVSSEIAALRAIVAREPENLDARLNLAYASLAQQDMMSVFEQTEYVLQRSPGNPRALSYQSLVRLAMGQGEQALSMLKEALARDPNLLDGWIHLGIVYSQLGRHGEATKALQEAMRRHPEENEMLTSVLAEIRAREAMGGNNAPVVPPVETAEAAFAGVIELAPNAGRMSGSSSVLFLTVRAAGVASGPPVAVKRLPAIFPAQFSISASDSMMGQALPDLVRIEARIDSDGNPLTREESDPSFVVDPVKKGTRDLQLVLR